MSYRFPCGTCNAPCAIREKTILPGHAKPNDYARDPDQMSECLGKLDKRITRFRARLPRRGKGVK